MTTAGGRGDARRGTALALDGIVKRYGALTALDGASLHVARGTLHAVLGENGAGKTTLMRVAFGIIRPDAGTVRVDGVARRFETPGDASAAGIGMVHQHFTIVPAMTVAENVALGGRGSYDPRQAAARVRALGDATGLRLEPDARAGALGVAAQQRLEVLKALARSGEATTGGTSGGTSGGTRLLILDEPAAVLGPAEAEELLGWLRRWVDAGGTAVLVTHKLRDALRYADAVTVLRRGATVLAERVRTPGTAAPLTEAALATAMLGGDAAIPGVDAIDDRSPAVDPHILPGPERGAMIARLAGVRVVDPRGVERLRDVSLVVRAGEVVGVAAVEGSGEHELLRLLAGRLTRSAAHVVSGHVQLPARVAFIPEDRHRDALLLDASLADNVALAGAGARRGLLRWPRIRRRTAALIASADVRGGGPDTRAGALSGGNQQKFVVARELEGTARVDGEEGDQDAVTPPPALVIAENPTRGLDIRAAAAVRDRLRAAASGGAGVVVYAGDLDEVLAFADRVLVVYDGTVREAARDRTAVGRLMLGASR